MSGQGTAGGAEVAAIEKLKGAREALLGEIRKVIVGQQEVMDLLLIAMFFRGGIVCWRGCRGWRRR